MKVLVLGGGLAGLSSACELTRKGVDVTVLEREHWVGGLAASFTGGGFTYDLGPHRFHTGDAVVAEHVKGLLAGDVEEKVRVSRILLQGRFFDYPLKVGNAVFTMPPLTTARIAADYVGVKLRNLFTPRQDRNFEDWVVNRFGWTLYDIYFRVYTEKTWGIPCTMLSADWAAQRISLLSLWDTLVKTLGKGGSTPRTYASRFYYPRSGGIGRISEAYEDGIIAAGGKVLLDCHVTEVEVEDDAIVRVGYGGGSVDVSSDDMVFSTIPLTSLVNSIRPQPSQRVLEATSRLKFRSIVFVHMIFNKDRISRDHWIYLPELKYASNRVSESKNFNERNAPEGKTVVNAEITCQKGDGVWAASSEELSRRILDDMVSAGLVRRDEYVDSKIHRIEHAYPIYDLEYKKSLETVVEYLKTIRNLRFFGRNGLFRYNNMDHSIGMGLTAAKSVTDRNMDYMRVATEEHWFG
ncbi:MAG: FAD-dependent oxidoreductase [Candidatus Altiarchaeota archaeon]